MSKKKRAIIIGAGPAGLTAAYELLKRTDVHPIVIERDPEYVGGISRTVNYKGNRIDIGGHRFFSKSDRVMHWWSEILPVHLPEASSNQITYQNSVRALTEGMRQATATDGDDVMTVRPRKTRIIYKKKFFPYPIELSLDVLLKLGPIKTIKIGLTYIQASLFPIQKEKTLEDFFINRFGKELYETFFKSYTEKVWGTSCREMSAEWGAQRIKGLSVVKAITHAVKKLTRIGPLSGKTVETSLIEQFLYPTFGPGHLWEKVAEKVKGAGGEILMGTEVINVNFPTKHTVSVKVKNGTKEKEIIGDYILSSTDVQMLVNIMGIEIPQSVKKTAENLEYRDFLTVGILLEKPPTEKNGKLMSDTWMYVHEEDVRVGRIQFFHNWHPKLVASQNHGWIGLEYFCNENDSLWSMEDSALIELGKKELELIGLRNNIKVLDGTVIRQKKAYPGYFGAYKNFSEVRDFLNTIPNLFPIGRNGMHRYNNQDHSMLAAMKAVDLIATNQTDKMSLWEINTEEEYHEEK